MQVYLLSIVAYGMDPIGENDTFYDGQPRKTCKKVAKGRSKLTKFNFQENFIFGPLPSSGFSNSFEKDNIPG